MSKIILQLTQHRQLVYHIQQTRRPTKLKRLRGLLHLPSSHSHLLEHDAFAHRGAAERVRLHGSHGVRLHVLSITPPLLAAERAQLAPASDTLWLAHCDYWRRLRVTKNVIKRRRDGGREIHRIEHDALKNGDYAQQYYAVIDFCRVLGPI